MLIPSWRWFGPDDPVSLEQVVQAGATCVVSALHQVPVGNRWEREPIRERKERIEKAGLTWGVVESVPVHESIKTRSGNYQTHIENFKQSLRNLGKEGIHTVCYNFMPALDWSRTRLNSRQPDGSELSSFNQVHFAVVDIHLLKRPGAAESYPESVANEAYAAHDSMTRHEKEDLLHTFLLGFPGSGESFSPKQVLERIGAYREIDKQTFQEHLIHFLTEVLPVAEESGIYLAIHPDDPPWSLLGLPRVMSTLDDALHLIRSVDSRSNGLTFCSGSFGAADSNDLPRMVTLLSDRIHFLHLRNVRRDPDRNFSETHLLEGDIDIPAIMRTMVLEDRKRASQWKGYRGIPVRPDHGARILGDFSMDHYPGYSLYGRMKSLAEIRGLEAGIRKGLIS